MNVTPLHPKNHTTAHRDYLRACRGVADQETAAAQAFSDVSQLRYDVRDVDPREVWGCLCLMDRQRLQAALVVALAAIPARPPLGELVAWTDSFAPPEEMSA